MRKGDVEGEESHYIYARLLLLVEGVNEVSCIPDCCFGLARCHPTSSTLDP